jgi:colicin import membrane protein
MGGGYGQQRRACSMTPKTTRDSSLMFSIDELMAVEQQRVVEERADEQKRVAEAEHARHLAEERERRANEARTRAERLRAAEHDARLQEHRARIAALRDAEVQRVVLETEKNARAQQHDAERQHQERMAELRVDEKNRSLKAILIGGALMALAGIAITGGLVHHNGELRSAENASLRRQLVASRQKFADAQRGVDQRGRELERMQAELGSHKRALRAKGDEVQRLKSLLAAKPGVVHAPPPVRRPKPPPLSCKGREGDPLCSDIAH